MPWKRGQFNFLIFSNWILPFTWCVLKPAQLSLLVHVVAVRQTGRVMWARTDRRGLNNWILGRSQSVITWQSIPLKGTQTFRHTEPHISSSFFWHLLDSLVIMMDPMMVLIQLLMGIRRLRVTYLVFLMLPLDINLTWGVESILWWQETPGDTFSSVFL